MNTRSRDTILEDPQTTIGVQELLKVGYCDKTGFLRRQGRIERTLTFLRWRQTFVVISRGCLYVFKDELARHPKKSVSLRLYKQVSRLTRQPSPQWAFELVPVDGQTTKAIVFACFNEETRKEWMKQMKESMKNAHRVQEQEAASNDEYVYIEKAIEIPDTAKCQTLPEVNGTHRQSTESNDEEDYSTIDEAAIGTIANQGKRPQKPTFKPEAPTPIQYAAPNKAVSKPVKKAKVPTPQPSPVTTKKVQARPESEYNYEGSDRDEVAGILTVRPEGTFLVRKSRNDNKQVLSVNVSGVLKEFKIFKKEGKVTLDNVDFFTDVDELIINYKKSNLPKKTTSLYRPYTVTDTGNNDLSTFFR